MPHTRKKPFCPKPLSLSNKLFFDVGSTLIINQQKPEKQILNEEFYNVSDFEKKTPQTLKQKFFTTSQILILRFYNAADFELKKNTTRYILT